MTDARAAGATGTVNLGIVAHVDAGKTTLTERLLFETQTIRHLGSVDAGTTQTDSDAVERRRGITIRAAVASFTYGSSRVNLIDTPGHAEFIAEVERALGVLDGAVLVVSAVEGVQAQTRILMRTLRALSMPTLIFVNKIDRMGARAEELLSDMREALSVRVVPLNRAGRLGTAEAEVRPVLQDPEGAAAVADVLAGEDDELLERLVAGEDPSPGLLWPALARQVRSGDLQPVIFGCAREGKGVGDLLVAIDRLLPRAAPSDGSAARGTVFAMERGSEGEKVGYLRLYEGRVAEREPLTWHRPSADAVSTYRAAASTLEVVGGSAHDVLRAGEIGRIRGIAGLRVGDRLGSPEEAQSTARFARPTLESVVSAGPGQASRLHAALTELAEQDPLISARSLEGGRTSVLLYGEVQKEVLAEWLYSRYGIEAVFEESQIIYLERPHGSGAAVLELGRSPFVAGIGLRIRPAPRGTGIRWVRKTHKGSLPKAFRTAIRETVVTTLRQGLLGWPVTDCEVALIHNEFDNACSTGGDFRGLTPLIVMRALAQAGTAVYEPCHAFEVEVPVDTFAAVTALVSRAEANITVTARRGSAWQIGGEIPARSVNDCQRELPGLTRGEGVWWSRPEGDRAVRGERPRRERTDGNPLNAREYMRNRMLGPSAARAAR